MNYKIEAIEILLNEDCILERYHSLIPYKTKLLNNLKKQGYNTKNDCFDLSDAALIKLGLPNKEASALFKRFLVMYDVKDSKLKEIESFDLDKKEAKAIASLYLLPGVKFTRAKLYYDSGYTSLAKIAKAKPEQIIEDTSKTIKTKGLDLKAPFLKEVKTHIAVAKVIKDFLV